MSGNLFCVDCDHHGAKSGEYRTERWCRHPLSLDPVTKEPEVRCADMRERHSLCGPQATLFVPAMPVPAGSDAGAGPDADREA